MFNHFLPIYIILLFITIIKCYPSTTNTETLLITTESINSATTNDEKIETKNNKLHIDEMHIESNVSNRFATTSVISRVRNGDKIAREATFSIILPDKAYISGFLMEIKGVTYKAYVEEKKKAKEVYDQAIASGQSAGHVAANARDSNRFTVSVNIEPETKATFHLTYEELLQRNKEQYEIVLNIHPGELIENMDVKVNINESLPLKFVRTPSFRSGNEISKNDDDKIESEASITNIDKNTAIVSFHPDIIHQKQIAQKLGKKESDGLSGQFIVQYDVEHEQNGGQILVKDGYFVHFFAPPNLKPLPKHVVFVLDTSGSMWGIRITQLKEAMNSILNELNSDDTFNIVEFSDDIKTWRLNGTTIEHRGYSYPSDEPKVGLPLPKSFEATEDNKKKAIAFINEMTASGATDILNALEIGLKIVETNRNIAIIEKENINRQPMIIFLTDGEPTVGETNNENIIRKITELNTKTPIFSLSFGDGADRQFLEKISLKNYGFARHIYEAADASLQLQDFYKQISSPLLNNIEFKYISTNIQNKTKTIFPIYFKGGELVIAGRLIQSDEILTPPQIEAKTIDQTINFAPKITNSIGGLERVWAYLTVKQLLEEKERNKENEKTLTEKALELCLKYSFVTSVSSLVVVKPNETAKAVDTSDASKTQHSNLPTPVLASAGPLFSLKTTTRGRPQYPSISNYDTDELTNRFSVDSDFTTFSSPKTPLDMLKDSLTWIGNILESNGTVNLPNGNFQLGLDSPPTNLTVECPQTPNNGTIGRCELLTKCQLVWDDLTDLTTYLKYFCPLQGFAGVCCPTLKN